MAAEVQNCPLRADGRCPDDWEAMTPTQDERVHECPACRHLVFLCRTRDDALFLGRQGWRVALADVSPPAPAGPAPAAWARHLALCFAGPTFVWAGSPAARWHARDTVKAGVDAGANMADILSAVTTLLQDHGVRPDHIRAELGKIKALQF